MCVSALAASCTGEMEITKPMQTLTGTTTDIPGAFVSFHVRNVTLCFIDTFARNSAPLFCQTPPL
ncbi:MAG: hypothetical protein ABI120_18375 [Gemmatimonadaceae bacterium]